MSTKKNQLFAPAVEASGKAERPKSAPAVEAMVEEEDDIVDTILDGAYAAAQGASYNFADETYGAGRSLYEKGDLSDYEVHRDEARHQWAVARDRSPITTTLSEVGGAMVSPANKVFGAAKGLRGVIRGAAEGATQSYGATEKEDGTEQAIEMGLGAGMGAGTGVVANVVSKGFSKSPTAVRAEVLGVKGKDYLVRGNDRKRVVERISGTGMLKNRKMEYDPHKMKFVPRGKKKWDLDELEMNTEERLLARAQDATDKLQGRKEKEFGKVLQNSFVTLDDIEAMAGEIAQEYSERGLIKGPYERQEAVFRLHENIKAQLLQGTDNTHISLDRLDKIKRMAQEDVKNFSKGLGELGDNDELARITARKLKNLVEDSVGSDAFRKLNAEQHDFLSVAGDLRNKVKSLELAPPKRMQFEKTNAIEGVLDNMRGGSQGRLNSADTLEWWQNHIPKPARAVIPYMLEETPGAVFRQNLQGQEMRGHYRGPAGGVENIPEQLIRTPLPRSTEGLMQKKPFVLAKIAQMMPEMYEAVKDVYDHNPENLGELAQVIAMKMPHFFEKDKYNRFDNRIVSEADKQKAIKDILLKKDINAIAQAKLITKLNQEGIYEG